jgi:hypothetical protein
MNGVVSIGRAEELKITGATKSVLYGNLRRKLTVRWELRFRQDLSVEAEESPLLEAVTRERLVKTEQAGKDLACAVVICKMWRLAMAL